MTDGGGQEERFLPTEAVLRKRERGVINAKAIGQDAALENEGQITCPYQRGFYEHHRHYWIRLCGAVR